MVTSQQWKPNEDNMVTCNQGYGGASYMGNAWSTSDSLYLFFSWEKFCVAESGLKLTMLTDCANSLYN